MLIIFDLDDTLYDMVQIRDSARRQSVIAMIERGLGCSVEEGVNKLKEINEKEVIVRFKKLADYFGCYNEEILKTGIDYYISSNSFLLALGKKLKKSFKGEYKLSRRIFTKNKMTSRDVYRLTVLFRLY